MYLPPVSSHNYGHLLNHPVIVVFLC